MSDSTARVVNPTLLGGRGDTPSVGNRPRLSRDSRLGQRKHAALGIQRVDALMDRAVECVRVSEGLMGEMMRLEIMPDGLDVV